MPSRERGPGAHVWSESCPLGFVNFPPGLGWFPVPSALATAHSWSSPLKNEELRASLLSFFVQFLAGEIATN